MSQYEKDKERLQLYMAQLRGCAGLSAEALANKVGLTKQAISYMETHPEKPMTKMQYICIRAVFDEEYRQNPENINLRDCYDLVFSDPIFYDEHKDRVEYAMYQAVEDTKTQKKKNRADAKKANSTLSAAGGSLVGATAATVGIGGIAAATFPLMFPIVGSAIAGAAMAASTKKRRNEVAHERASSNVSHPSWMTEAFDAAENNSEE